LSDPARWEVLDAYLAASRSVFWLWVTSTGTCLVLMVFVRDMGLKRQDDEKSTEVLSSSDDSEGAIAVESVGQNEVTAENENEKSSKAQIN